MKNKTIKIVLFLLLCSPFAHGQQKIDKETFEKLVDYANCKYVETFIEKHYKEKSANYEIYQKNLTKRLQEASLKNLKEILSYSDLNNQLSNDTLAQELAEIINNKKTKFNDYQDNISLIKSLDAKVWYHIDLRQTATNIQNSILSKFEPNHNKSKNTKPISEAEVVKKQTIHPSTNDTAITELQKSLKIFKLIILGALILLFIFLVVIFYLMKKNLREYIINQILGSKRVEKKFAPKEVKPYDLSEKDINVIANRVLEQKRLTTNEIKPKPTRSIIEPIESSKPISKYLKGKSGKIFNRVENSPDNSFFKLLNENDETAQFEFFGNEEEALAKRIFSEDICKIVSGSYQNSRSIITIKPGKVKRIGEQWEVTEPIQIKLI